MNDQEREQWVLNDEGLYRWWRCSGMGMRRFLRRNRADIDAAILPVVDRRKPPHHLAYGPGRRF